MCRVCTSNDTDLLEKVGREALAGAISWREAGRQAQLNERSLRNHMEKHVVAPEQEAAAAVEADVLDGLIDQARNELMEQFHLQPSDIKPIILVAIRNLDSLKQTKPSAELLVRALKTIQEMTGMKNEQRLMLDYARAQGQRKAIQVPNLAGPKELT